MKHQEQVKKDFWSKHTKNEKLKKRAACYFIQFKAI